MCCCDQIPLPLHQPTILIFSPHGSPLQYPFTIVTPLLKHITIVVIEVTIMILLSSFRVATCFKLIVVSLYYCTSEVLDFFMHILKSKVFMFGGCNELCLKVVGERRWVTASYSLDVDHLMFTIIIKLELNKFGAPKSKLQSVFCFLFFESLLVHLFLISYFQVPPCLLL